MKANSVEAPDFANVCFLQRQSSGIFPMRVQRIYASVFGVSSNSEWRPNLSECYRPGEGASTRMQRGLYNFV